MKKKKKILLYILILVLVLIVLPYAKVEILSINADKKLESFDLSCFDNIYCAGTPYVYDCKIYSYWPRKYAKVFYVFGNCEFGVMAKLKWNSSENCWEHSSSKTMWSAYGGSAHEFYWPLYYGKRLFSGDIIDPAPRD